MQKRTELHLLNLLKVFVFQVAMIFHFVHLVWMGKHLEFYFLQQSQPSFAALIRFTEIFWYSGWAIVILFAFLYGTRWGRGKPIPFRLIYLLVIFQLILNLAYWKFQKLNLFWDVYGFLAVCFLVCRFLSDKIKNKKPIGAIAVVGLIFTFFPLSHVPWFSQTWIGSILWGGCINASSGFPVFPFIGLFISFYFIGYLYQTESLGFLKRAPKWSEMIFWTGILIFSSQFYLQALDFFKNVYLMGECRFIDLSRAQFWAGLVPFVFLLRLSLIERLNRFLEPYLSWLRKLEISGNFAGVYLLTYVVGAALVLWLQSFLRAELLLFYYFCIFLYPVVELLFFILKRLRSLRLKS